MIEHPGMLTFHIFDIVLQYNRHNNVQVELEQIGLWETFRIWNIHHILITTHDISGAHF